MTAHADGIDPDALETCLRVLAAAEALPPEHPDAVAVRRATASLFKAVKERRRVERRTAVLAADAALTAATATGAPGRIDDETAGLPLRPAVDGSSAGTLAQPRACYVCKERFVELDAFYHQLCPACAARNHARRDARTDLRGRRALLTGGRAKIGMYIALRLLRDGAQTTITTRFPRDAARRFAAMTDSEQWLAPPDDRRHRPARPRPGRRARRRDRGAGAARHPHQQRVPDGAPLARGLRAARAGRGSGAAGRAAPGDPRLRAGAEHRHRRTRGRRQRARGHRARGRRQRARGHRARGRRQRARGHRARGHRARRHRARGRRERGRARALDADAGRPRGAGSERALGVPGADRGRPGDRRRRARARPRRDQQLEPGRRRGRPRRAARGPALQPDRAVHPRRPAARRARRVGARRTYIVNVSAIEGSSSAATRVPAIRTRTCPRPR